jgi:hypothetical protein
MTGLYLNGYMSYKMFLAVSFHFKQDKYDIFVKKGLVKCSPANFEKRPDTSFYYRLGAEYRRGDLADFYMANIMAGCTHISEYSDLNFKEWKSKMHRIDYIFEEDLKKLQFIVAKHELKFNDLFKSVTGSLPLALQLLDGGHINLETVCIIDKILGGDIVLRFNEQITDTFVWPNLRRRIIKYSPWLRLELSELKLTLIKYIK